MKPWIIVLVSALTSLSVSCDSSKPESQPAEAKGAMEAKAGADTKAVTEAKAAAEAKATADAKTAADAVPPSERPVDSAAALHPDTVLAFESTEPPSKWKLVDQEGGVYEEIDGSSRKLWFRTHALTLAGSPHTLALWGLDANTAQIHAALLSGTDGAWTPVWVRRPFIEDAEGPDGEVYLPDVVQIGPERWGVLHSPYLVACGAAPCPPEVDNVIYEIAPKGPVEIWKKKISVCRPPGAEESLAANQCFIAFEPGKAADVYDLVVTIQRKRKLKKPQRYVLRDGRYEPAR